MRRFFLVFLAVFIFSVVTGITLDEIREISKSDPERAYMQLMRYLKDHPGDEKALRLGKIIAAKRELMKNQTISDAVLKENTRELIKKMSQLKNINKHTMALIETMLPDFYDTLRSMVLDFSEEAFKVCEILPERVREPEGLEREVVDRFIENPLGFDPSVINKLRCMNLSRLKRKVSAYLRTKLVEKNYMAASRLVEMLSLSLPEATQLKLYSDLAQQLSTIDVSSMSVEDFEDLVNKYEKITLQKEKLASRIKAIYLMLSERMDLSFCEDREICPEIRKVSEVTNVSTSSESAASKTEILKRGFDQPWKTALFVILAVATSMTLVLIIIKARDPKRRIFRIKKKLERDPMNPQLHIKLASLYEEMGKTEEAMEEYRIAYKLFNSERDSSGNDRS